MDEVEMIDCEQNKLCEMILPEEDESEVCERCSEEIRRESTRVAKALGKKDAKDGLQTALTAAEKEEDKTLIHADSSCRLGQ
jgi:hypothetical protein